MKPRTQLRFLSIALFALWGRAGAEDLPPFVVSPSLLGKPATVRPGCHGAAGGSGPGCGNAAQAGDCHAGCHGTR